MLKNALWFLSLTAFSLVLYRMICMNGDLEVFDRIGLFIGTISLFGYFYINKVAKYINRGDD